MQFLNPPEMLEDVDKLVIRFSCPPKMDDPFDA
jgi:hypothetical protein